MRCGSCRAWAGNYKYDKRSKEEIRRDKISEWRNEFRAVPCNGTSRNSFKNKSAKNDIENSLKALDILSHKDIGV